MNDFTDITASLTDVSGGATRRAAAHAQPQSHGGFFGWLDGMYHSVINHVAGHIGGNKLADQMYGKHATAADRSRAQTAMKQYLAGSHKLPKGVPNLFG